MPARLRATLSSVAAVGVLLVGCSNGARRSRAGTTSAEARTGAERPTEVSPVLPGTAETLQESEFLRLTWFTGPYRSIRTAASFFRGGEFTFAGGPLVQPSLHGQLTPGFGGGGALSEDELAKVQAAVEALDPSQPSLRPPRYGQDHVVLLFTRSDRTNRLELVDPAHESAAFLFDFARSLDKPCRRDMLAGLQAVRRSAKERWGHVLGVNPGAEQTRVSRFLPDHRIWYVRVRNPASDVAGRPEFIHAMLVRGKKVEYVDSDAAAAGALSSQGHEVADARTARELSLVFADIRAYQPQMTQLHQTSPPEDWGLACTDEEGEAWNIRLAVMCDPFNRACRQYRIRITRSGKMTAEPGKLLGRDHGYR